MWLVCGSQSLGTSIVRSLPELLLECKAYLLVGLKHLLEVGMEVIVFLLPSGPRQELIWSTMELMAAYSASLKPSSLPFAPAFNRSLLGPDIVL